MIVPRGGMGAIEKRTAIQGMRRLALAVSSRRRGMGDNGDGVSISDIGPSAIPGSIPSLSLPIDIPSLPTFTPSPIDLGPLPGTPGGAPVGYLPATTPGSSTWQQTLQQLLLGGEKIAATATLPTGAYTSTVYNPATGQYQTVTANQVPGAVPGFANIGASLSGFSAFLPIILIAGVGIVLISQLGKK